MEEDLSKHSNFITLNNMFYFLFNGNKYERLVSYQIKNFHLML